MTNRILPETLPALYRKHGVVPMQLVYDTNDLDGRCFACGASMIYRETYGAPLPFADTPEINNEIADALRFEREYISGYTHGFDTDPAEQKPRGYWAQSKLWQLGYRDGVAGWAAVKDMAVTR